MKRILVTTSSFSVKHLLAGQEVFYNPHGRRLDEGEVLALIREIQPVGMIAGVEPLTRSVLQAADGLQVISRCGIGLDSVDLEAARELGIEVCNTPEAPVPAVAEMALALMLAWLRRIPSGDQEIRNGKWVRKSGSLLAGKTVGIVGCGRIGTRLSSLLAAFGCTVIGSDPHITAHPTCRMVPPDELFRSSDIVSLHIPLTDETRNSINVDTFKRMKSTALLVNTARGGVINEDDLHTALSQNLIAGAALDVYEW